MESRPVDGGGGVCKKVPLLPQNGVILVMAFSVGLGPGYISLYIYTSSLSRSTVNTVKTRVTGYYFSPSCGGGGGGGVKNRPVARGVCKMFLFWPQNGPNMVLFQ